MIINHSIINHSIIQYSIIQYSIINMPKRRSRSPSSTINMDKMIRDFNNWLDKQDRKKRRTQAREQAQEQAQEQSREQAREQSREQAREQAQDQDQEQAILRASDIAHPIEKSLAIENAINQSRECIREKRQNNKKQEREQLQEREQVLERDPNIDIMIMHAKEQARLREIAFAREQEREKERSQEIALARMRAIDIDISQDQANLEECISAYILFINNIIDEGASIEDVKKASKAYATQNFKCCGICDMRFDNFKFSAHTQLGGKLIFTRNSLVVCHTCVYNIASKFYGGNFGRACKYYINSY